MLITGAGSGLGKALFELFEPEGAIGLSRENARELLEKHKLKGVETIVHCAFHAMRSVMQADLPAYLRDNLDFTRKLLEIPHRKFVLLSTTDLYPIDGKVHAEDSEIDLSGVQGIYPLVKLMNESLVRDGSKSHLILRASLLVGKYSRPNNLMKLIHEEKPSLTLSSDSEWNVIAHSDVAGFIRHAIEKKLSGTYNICSSSSICLSDLARELGKSPKYGTHVYKTSRPSNQKARAIFPEIDRSSLDVVRRFISGG